MAYLLWSPFTAPPAAMAAETPQIETAVPRIEATHHPA